MEIKLPNTWKLYDSGKWIGGGMLWRFCCMKCKRECDVFGDSYHEPRNHGNNIGCIL